MTSSTGFQGDATTLCQIFVIFRHGERAPMFIWSTDPNKGEWPNGPASLTNNGKEQGYMIGKLLRKMYPGFLDDKYLKDEIYIHSPNTDRTLMSALCCLAGLYPPKGDDVWLEDMPWQPIPVNTAPIESDPFALTFDQEDFLTSIQRANTTTDDEYKILAKYKDILQKMTDKSKNDGQSGNLMSLLSMLDGYAVKAKVDIPAYLPPGLDLDLKTTSALMPVMFSVIMRCKGIIRPSVHHLTDILSKAEKKIEGKMSMPKAFLYSSHDVILNNIFLLLKIPALRPSYAATMVFELHKNPGSGEYYMKLMFKDNIESPEDPKVLPINGATAIPFSEFQKIIQGLKVEVD